MSQYPDASFIKSANALDQFVADDGSEVAVAGRSNAGKSSAINVIVNRRQFARTSKTPGRTQLVNFFSLGLFACFAPSGPATLLQSWGWAASEERRARPLQAR